ncbi:unnamed protein product, partial [Closterium sp. NIES-54]
LREWFLRGSSGGSCLNVIRTGDRAGQTCGRLLTQHRCFSRLDDAWRAEFGDDVVLPRWGNLVKSRIVIFDLDFDAFLSAMHALSVSVEGDCYRCVPPDPGIAAAALGATESCALPGTVPAEALHTFTLDSGASPCFFRDSTNLTPLPAPVPVRLADPSGGPVMARSSTVLPCPAVPSGSLSDLHLPSFSTNLVSTAALQDAMVTTTAPGGQRVSICTCTQIGRHLATFTRRQGSSLYTLATEPPLLRLFFGTIAWVTPPFHVFVACTLVSLSLDFPGLCLPCHPRLPRVASLASRGGSAPLLNSSSFPLTTSPLQTLHMDVWGPARVSGHSRGRYFLLAVDDYTRYTMVFPLRSKGQVVDVLIPWIRTVRLQLRDHFGQDLPVLRLHSDRGGEFSSNLLREFCRGEGILLSFTLPDSPQQNGIAERRIGLVMEVARTSMIHVAAPHFQWPFAVQYAAHQHNLLPRVSLPKTSPTLRLRGKVGDASVFWVWGSRAFVRDTSADKLSPRAIPCVFLGFVLDAPGWQFYHPTSRRVLPSQIVTFDESVPFYRLFPYRSTPPPPPPLFLAPGPPPVAIASSAARGAASGGASSRGAEPGGAGSEGAKTGGAEPRGVGSGGAEPGGAEPEGVEPGGAASEGVESGGAEPQGAALSGGSAGASPRLSPQQLREWFVRCARLRRGATGAGGAGGVGAAAGASGTGGAAATGPGGAQTRGTGAAGTGGVEGAGVLGPAQEALELPELELEALELLTLALESQPQLQPASPLPAPSPYTEQSGGLTERREPASRPILPVCTARRAPCSRPPPVPSTHAMALRPSCVPLRVALPAPPNSSLIEVPNLESDRARAASPAISRLLATAVTDPSLESATASALVAELLDFAAACRLNYATAIVADSTFASPPSVQGECALGTDVLEDRREDFECLAAAIPCFASMLLAPEGDPDAPDIPTPRSYAEAITGLYSSRWQAAMDAEMASWNSTCTYFDEVPPPGANIVDGMWIFSVKRPLCSPPAFRARYVARGFSQRHGVDFFQTFSPTPKMTTLRVLLHVAAQRDYELHFLEFSTAFLQGSLHEEIWLRRPPGFTGTFLSGTQQSFCRPVYGLRQAPREWHDTLRTTLMALGLQITRDRARRTTILTQCFGFQFSLPQSTPLSTSHSLSAPPSDESVEPSGPYPELLGCLMYLMTCTRPDLACPLSLLARYVAPGRHQKVHWDAAKRVMGYLCSTTGMGLVLGGRGPVVLTGHADASWVDDSATQRSSQGYTFSLGFGSISWRSTRSSSVLSSSCEAEIYAGAMAAQELRWLTYLLIDLGEQPRSPPALYVENKAMIALCQEHRLEHRTKHIALRYFLARELQQRGQLRLAYVATRANIGDVFTKALPPGDHQRFVTVLGLVPTLPHLLTT